MIANKNNIIKATLCSETRRMMLLRHLRKKQELTLEAAAAMIQRGPITASATSRCWHCPFGTGFTSMQNARIVESGRLPCRLQSNACEVRQRMQERAKNCGNKVKDARETRNSEMPGIWKPCQEKKKAISDEIQSNRESV